MSAANARIASYPLPSPYVSAFCTLSNVAGIFLYEAKDPSEDVADIARVDASGAYTFFDASTKGLLSNAVMGSDGNVWFALNQFQFGVGTPTPSTLESMSAGGQVLEAVQLPEAGLCGTTPFYYAATWIVAASDGNLYALAEGDAVRCRHFVRAILKISTAGVVLARYFGQPSAITVGSDGNVWFAAAGDTNIASSVIERITPDGSLASYAVPHPPVSWLVAGTDGALWFTEGTADKLGRLSTSGAITEYNIPFPGLPGYIIACPDPGTTAECGTNGGVWFVQGSAAQTTSSIIRFNKP